MNLRFYNANVLLLNRDLGAKDAGEHRFDLIQGELWVKGNRILYIGDGTDTDRIYENIGETGIVWDREIDA